MRGRGHLLALALLVACGDPRPFEGHDVHLRVTADVEEVALGEAFIVTVVRIWHEDLVPDPYPDGLLAPLDVELVETVRRDGGGFVEETRRYRAHAFVLGDVSVPATSFTVRSRSGAAERVARGNRLEVRVRPALDPGSPGPAELPGDLMSEPFPWRLTAAVAGAVVLGALGFCVVRRRRRAGDSGESAAPERATGPAAWERALGRLERLRETKPASAEEDLAFHVEAASLLRDFLAGQHAVGSGDLTTEEVVRALRAGEGVSDFHAGVLADLLRQCDLVKFACRRPSDRERESLLATGVVLVRETAGEGGAS